MAAPGPIYLDHMASTPLDPRVRDAMLPWLDPAAAGNPHSQHPAGWRAGAAVDAARAEVAALIGASPGEIVLTSGASEANNLALFGASRPGAHVGRSPIAHPVTSTVLASAVEHPSVLACLPELERRGRRTGVIPVDEDGTIRLEALERMLAAAGEHGVVSVMAANHEVGRIQPLAEVVRLARAAGALVHSDATQLLSTASLDVRALGLDLLSLSGHKLYGPQGIGALWARDGVALEPQLRGGGQQGGRRAGTVPVALAVGLGEACRIVRRQREEDARKMRRLQARLWQGLRRMRPDAVRNGGDDGLPHCLSVALPGVDAADLLLDLPELCASTGSACASGSPGPSPVLLAMGRTAEEAHETIRFGIGRFTTADEIDRALALLSRLIRSQSAPAMAGVSG